MKIPMGDFNFQIGPDRDGWDEVIGGMAEGESYDNVERLQHLQSKARREFFQHWRVHKQT